jgi:hypothetical protein
MRDSVQHLMYRRPEKKARVRLILEKHLGFLGVAEENKRAKKADRAGELNPQPSGEGALAYLT